MAGIYHCGVFARFKTYVFRSKQDKYREEWLHICVCRHPNCQKPDFLYWHGVDYDGFAGQMERIAPKDEAKWLARVADSLDPEHRQGPIVSEATRKMAGNMRHVSKKVAKKYVRIVKR